MLFTTAKAFFALVDEISREGRLTIEEERECARRMRAGDGEARKALLRRYLPVVASFIRRSFSKEPSLDLIYRGIAVLEETLDKYDFQNENITFTHALSTKLRRMMAAYIADSSV